MADNFKTWPLKKFKKMILTNLVFALDMLGGTDAEAFPRKEGGGVPSNVGIVWCHRGPGLAAST